MELDRFIRVLKNYSESSEQEALEIISLKEDFPYSQPLHALSARVSKDHGFRNQQEELQLAAIYATDRGILKEVMTSDRLRSYTQKKPTEVGKERIAVPETDTSDHSEEIHFDPGSLAEEVMFDLEKLQHLKHNFEMLFPDGGSWEHGHPETNAVVTKEKQPVVKSKPKGRIESPRSKKERIIALAKAMEAEAENDTESEGEHIIDEIVNTKQEIVPESEKQKHQLEIIEQFIKTQPSLSNKKENRTPVPPGDLTTIKTGEFSDKIVSETLVEILVKQGKNEKAIEVLKKLIWKFPQKKAYFAAQIEILKK